MYRFSWGFSFNVFAPAWASSRRPFDFDFDFSLLHSSLRPKASCDRTEIPARTRKRTHSDQALGHAFRPQNRRRFSATRERRLHPTPQNVYSHSAVYEHNMESICAACEEHERNMTRMLCCHAHTCIHDMRSTQHTHMRPSTCFTCIMPPQKPAAVTLLGRLVSRHASPEQLHSILSPAARPLTSTAPVCIHACIWRYLGIVSRGSCVGF